MITFTSTYDGQETRVQDKFTKILTLVLEGEGRNWDARVHVSKVGCAAHVSMSSLTRRGYCQDDVLKAFPTLGDLTDDDDVFLVDVMGYQPQQTVWDIEYSWIAYIPRDHEVDAGNAEEVETYVFVHEIAHMFEQRLHDDALVPSDHGEPYEYELKRLMGKYWDQVKEIT